MGGAGGEQAGIGQCGIRNKLNLATFACLSNVKVSSQQKSPTQTNLYRGSFKSDPDGT